jgi:hypothetical protein
MLNFPFSLGLIHRLTSEIDQLSGQQIQALRMATFGAMADDEISEFQSRRKRIGELIQELEALISQKRAA